MLTILVAASLLGPLERTFRVGQHLAVTLRSTRVPDEGVDITVLHAGKQTTRHYAVFNDFKDVRFWRPSASRFLVVAGRTETLKTGVANAWAINIVTGDCRIALRDALCWSLSTLPRGYLIEETATQYADRPPRDAHRVRRIDRYDRRSGSFRPGAWRAVR